MFKRSLFVILLLLFSVTISTAQDDSSIDCTQPLELWQIQGTGDTANCFDERIITTENNVVTVISRQGFFVQTLADFSDGDPNTSDGLFVLTNRFPGNWVQVGDIISIDGRVDEEFETSVIVAPSQGRLTIVGNTDLPEPFDLLSIDLSDNGGASAPLERYEGMYVGVTDAFVTAPTNRFNEFGISLTGERAFREAGVELDVNPDYAEFDIPFWDLNLEVVEVDMGETATEILQVPAGSLATATGGLTYNFSDYQIFADAVFVVMPESVNQAVRAREAGEFTIATHNAENLFDFTDDPNREDYRENFAPQDDEEYAVRIGKVSAYISTILDAPDIVALQEVENARVMTDLAFAIYEANPDVRYATCIIEGYEGRGIDTAYLIRTERVNYNDCYQMPGADEFIPESGLGILFSRPPLVLEAELIIGREQAFPITLINLHNRSLNGDETARVQLRRRLQAEAVANFVQSLQVEDPERHIVVLGDINAFQFSDGFVDVVGIIAGTTSPSDAFVGGEEDLVEPDLINQVNRVPAEDRYSYVFNGSSQVLDHILTNVTLDPYITDAQFGRGNADAPNGWFLDDTRGAQGTSDHDGFVLYILPE